ncbi:MAG: hypothetical protein OQJ96_08515 [Flavobacteriales bacterium]|nr:hypothetical protein [Flavobacteriales bacterium]MCW8913050.1 hypothetical protein [Flavobacteriales bacterium]MCW8938393.1 hypothetical protein [Flavobacteriales bacterium]MCW8940396.1 hypothetical protein [Flavobacteriales bacterium]MCW8967650.1 hypothetical protein [Flavobacteriales bacterium]
MRYFFLIFPIFLCLIFTSCSNNDSETIENIEISDIKTEERAIASNKVLSTVPLPLEAAEIFKTEGVIYDKNYLNVVENVNNYSTSTQKALNFGVYGVDLSYATIFDQTQACMLYINCSKKLAEELGLTNIFDVATIERIENNIENKDSVLSIAEKSYRQADTYLKSSHQEELAALVLAGGWIEGLYLGTRQSAKDIDKSLIKQKINDQKQSLVELIKLLESFKNDNIANLNNQLKQLDEIFIIKNQEDFINIADKVTKIRNQIIN